MIQFTDKNLLVVDDETFLLKLSTEYLTTLGFRVFQAEDGETALKIPQTIPLDGIICDLSLPGITGLEVLKHFHQHYPHIPFIILSGTMNIKDSIAALQNGAWDFLQKPLPDLGLLKYTLQRAFERAQLLKSRELYSAQLEKDVATRTWNLIEQIQEQKRTEVLLRKSIEEKEVLLQEVHHRVKNNLQIITSIMDFQRGVAIPLSVEETLVENQHRIMAMAMIHEGLYQSHDLTQISSRSYLENITNHYLQEAMIERRLEIHGDFADLPLDINQAFSLGLLYNEVISQILGILKKTSGAKQLISLKVSFETQAQQGVIVWKTQHTWDWENTAPHDLSRQLIQLLLSQARGGLKQKTGPHFELALTFPL